MPFTTQYIQTDGSLNVDGSIYVYQELFEGGGDISTFELASYVNSSSYYDASIMYRYMPNPSTLATYEVQGIYVNLIAAETITGGGKCVYVTSGGGVGPADADASNKMPAIGMWASVSTANAGDSINVLVYGIFKSDSFAFTTGKPVYVGTDTYPTTTAPSGAGKCVQVIGVADSYRSFVFFPTYDFMVLK
jgi:hypothetical protein